MTFGRRHSKKKTYNMRFCDGNLRRVTKSIKKDKGTKMKKNEKTKMEEVLLKYTDAKKASINQHYGNMPVPSKYKHGVAAYNTIPEAVALADELTDLIGYKHIVTVDDKLGCAVVEITDKFYLPTENSNLTMTAIKKYEYIFDSNCIPVDCNEKADISLTDDGNLAINGIHVVYTQEFALQSIETIEDKVLKIITSTKSDKVSSSFNAIVLLDYNTMKALLVIYPSKIRDIEKQEISVGDSVYDNLNNRYEIEQIALKKADTKIKGFRVLSFFWEAENIKGQYIQCANCKKTIWSAKDRKNYEQLSPEEENKQESKRDTIKLWICGLFYFLIIFAIVILSIYALKQDRIVYKTISVTVASIDENNKITIEDEKGKLLTATMPNETTFSVGETIEVNIEYVLDDPYNSTYRISKIYYGDETIANYNYYQNQ